MPHRLKSAVQADKPLKALERRRVIWKAMSICGLGPPSGKELPFEHIYTIQQFEHVDSLVLLVHPVALLIVFVGWNDLYVMK